MTHFRNILGLLCCVFIICRTPPPIFFSCEALVTASPYVYLLFLYFPITASVTFPYLLLTFVFIHSKSQKFPQSASWSIKNYSPNTKRQEIKSVGEDVEKGNPYMLLEYP